MRPRTDHSRKRAKLPPILEIDEDGVLVNELQPWTQRWSADGDEPQVGLDDWPAEFDD
jgi:hypothetical protein